MRARAFARVCVPLKHPVVALAPLDAQRPRTDLLQGKAGHRVALQRHCRVQARHADVECYNQQGAPGVATVQRCVAIECTVLQQCCAFCNSAVLCCNSAVLFCKGVALSTGSMQQTTRSKRTPAHACYPSHAPASHLDAARFQQRDDRVGKRRHVPLRQQHRYSSTYCVGTQRTTLQRSTPCCNVVQRVATLHSTLPHRDLLQRRIPRCNAACVPGCCRIRQPSRPPQTCPCTTQSAHAHARTHACTHAQNTHARARAHACTSMHAHARTPARAHTHSHRYTCRVCSYTHAQVHNPLKHARMRTCSQAHTCACVCVRARAYTSIHGPRRVSPPALAAAP